MKTLVIDPNAELPPFEQLRRQLIEQISTGQLAAATKLPAVRRLAAELALAPGTVARAYKELVSEGYLVSRGRNGTVVAPNASADPHVQAQKLTSDYVTAMQSMGFHSQEIMRHLKFSLSQGA
ncbi:MAG TPA: GntR family transcriptional regulator [Candidatus Yaniella excrementavium]|nr:GntR family transcriptional regulator [Candidatus Yaniella excrementavium]